MPAKLATQQSTLGVLSLSRITLSALAFCLLGACGASGGGAGDDSTLVTTSESDSNVSNNTNNADSNSDTDSDSNGQLLTTDECSVANLNQWVDDSMRDYYLFYDQVPLLNLADYTTPNALIRDLRVSPYDTFSNVSDLQGTVEVFDQGKDFGVGFNWRRDQNGDPRIVAVQRDSAAGEAGFRRGDILVSVNEVAWLQLTSQLYRDLIGTRESPQAVNFQLISAVTGEPYNVDVTAREYNINTVLDASVIDHPRLDARVAYLAFGLFIESSASELENAFAQFAASGVSELILDLRYNGGGRTSIARQLAELISSPATDGQLLIDYQFNDKYQQRNFSRFFENRSNGLGLTRVLVLTTGSTASSSEIVINSLKPYMEVITFGSRTVGKPYISAGRDNCDKRINALEAEGFNANGVSVFGGIPADCYARDDLTQDFGLSESSGLEGMLNSAAEYLLSGTCDSPPIMAEAARSSTTFNGINNAVFDEFHHAIPQIAVGTWD